MATTFPELLRVPQPFHIGPFRPNSFGWLKSSSRYNHIVSLTFKKCYYLTSLLYRYIGIFARNIAEKASLIFLFWGLFSRHFSMLFNAFQCFFQGSFRFFFMVFFRQKPSIYAGLGQGAIYSTLWIAGMITWYAGRVPVEWWGGAVVQGNSGCFFFAATHFCFINQNTFT